VERRREELGLREDSMVIITGLDARVTHTCFQNNIIIKKISKKDLSDHARVTTGSPLGGANFALPMGPMRLGAHEYRRFLYPW
jgi:hypothetical protein